MIGHRSGLIAAVAFLRPRTALGCLLWMALVPAVARAAEPTVGVDYVAPVDCPRSFEFIALVAARAPGSWRIREGDSGDLRFAIEIRDDGAGKVGRIQRTSASGTNEPREIAGSDCREVVQALALTAALSLDSLQAAHTVRLAAKAQPVATEAPPTPRSWLLGAGVSAVALLPPSPMAEATLFLEIRDARWPVGLSLHRPDVRLTFSHARNDLLSSPDQAAFSLTSAATVACPLGWSVLRACGTAQLGVLTGRGVDLDSPRSSRSLWLAAGGLARARWPLSRGFEIEVEASLRVPLRHVDFVVERPRVTLASVPAVIAGGGVALGVAIP
jgi:hypothetical protein